MIVHTFWSLSLRINLFFNYDIRTKHTVEHAVQLLVNFRRVAFFLNKTNILTAFLAIYDDSTDTGVYRSGPLGCRHIRTQAPWLTGTGPYRSYNGLYGMVLDWTAHKKINIYFR
jgi:hypothetical protein